MRMLFQLLMVVIVCLLITACNQLSKPKRESNNNQPNLTNEEIIEKNKNDPFLEAGYAETYPYALIIESAEVKYNDKYEATYYFTVRNESEETIVAFEIGGENCPQRFKVRLNPNMKYSGKIKLEDETGCKSSSYANYYSIMSIILLNGEKVHIWKGPTSRKH